VRLGALAALATLICVGGGLWWWLSQPPPWQRLVRPGDVLTPELQARSQFPPDDALRCKACHEQEYADWAGSQHAHANRLVSFRADAKAFNPRRAFTMSGFTSEVFQSWHDFVIRQTDPTGETSEHQAIAVIGVEPLIQYLTPFPGGRLQTIDPAYDPGMNEWFEVFPGEGRQPHEWGFWKNQGLNWNSQCAFCHMTDFQKNYSALEDSYSSTWKAMGISCSQCHPGMEAHLADPTAQVLRMNSRQVMSNCASCHSRREELTGAFHPGEEFHDHFGLSLPDISEIYYADGQVREENFEYASFITSAMGHAGVDCLDCHKAHSAGLTLPVKNNSLCMSCHTPPGTDGATPIPDPVAHSHHPAGSTGNQCIGCHMPETIYMARDSRPDHGFTIPDPFLTVQYGIPNACNRCHTDQSPEWAQWWVNEWYGPSMDRPSRVRAIALAEARQGTPGSLDQLLEVINKEENPAWRAGLISGLRGAARHPGAATVLQQAVSAEDPLVRTAALRVLAQEPSARPLLNAALDDPIRLVRLTAALELAAAGETLPESVRKEVQQIVDFQADSPIGALRKGMLAGVEGQSRRADEWFGRAAKLDPSAGMFAEIAHAQYAMGKLQGASSFFQQAVDADERDPASRYSFALLTAEMGGDPRPLLRETVAIDRTFGRAWYNLGLAEAARNNLDAAANALSVAEEMSPGDHAPPYALATVYLRLGEVQKARAAARRVLAIQPENRPAQRILKE